MTSDAIASIDDDAIAKQLFIYLYCYCSVNFLKIGHRIVYNFIVDSSTWYGTVTFNPFFATFPYAWEILVQHKNAT